MMSCCFAFSGLPFALIFRQELGRLVLELARFVELSLDAAGTIVQRFRRHLVDAEIAQAAHEDDEGDATQVSGSARIPWSVPSTFERVGDRRIDCGVGRRFADQPFDDRLGGICSDAANIRHGRLLGGGNGLLRFGQLDVELVLKLLATRFRFRRLLLARFVGDRLRAARASARAFS